MRTIAIVPTLNRVADLSRCLQALGAQTRAPERVLVVDNGSSDGTAERVSGHARTELIQLGAPAGAAAAFAAGMRSALEQGAQLLWLMDDDAVPEPEALERLSERVAGAEPGLAVGGAVPMLVVGDSERYAGWRVGPRAASGRGESPNPPGPSGEPQHAEVDWAPFAGLCLTADACRAAGELRADFVLWHADVDYCLRLRRHGYHLLTAGRAVVHHPPMALTSRRVLGRSFAVGAYPAWREYYDTRNRAIMRRELRGSEFEDGMPRWRRVSAELARWAATLAADSAGPRRVLMRARGYADGLRGRASHRPERGSI